MTWVKICGLSKARDVRAAEEAGADAIGLVLVPESPRAITADQAATLASLASVKTFLLLRDSSPSEMLDLASFVGVSGIQPYGSGVDEVTDAALRAGLEVLYPVPVGDRTVSLMDVRDDVLPILDTARAGKHGGTGDRFDPGLVDAAGRDWVVAGGLTPDNVADAVTSAKPWGVDVSSGVESAPGTKDPALIIRFVEEAKRP